MFPLKSSWVRVASKQLMLSMCWYLTDFSPSQDLVQGHFILGGSRLNHDSCVTKMIYPVSIPLLWCFRINSSLPTGHQVNDTITPPPWPQKKQRGQICDINVVFIRLSIVSDLTWSHFIVVVVGVGSRTNRNMRGRHRNLSKIPILRCLSRLTINSALPSFGGRTPLYQAFSILTPNWPLRQVAPRNPVGQTRGINSLAFNRLLTKSEFDTRSFYSMGGPCTALRLTRDHHKIYLIPSASLIFGRLRCRALNSAMLSRY